MDRAGREFFLNGLLGGGSYLDLRARSLQEPGPAMIAIAATSYDANGNAARMPSPRLGSKSPK
ncbi:MAG: hypothetical protein U0176_12785 [Bacteroidia bacterium]